MESMKNRRSIRKYSDVEVSDELLNDLFEVAARASTMGNLQLYSVIVTRDEANKEKLSPAHFNQPMVKQAPVVLTICADYNRVVKWCEARQAIPGYDNFQSFVAAFEDAMIFAQAFCDAAEAKGLGICYLGTTTYNADAIVEALSLPELVVPVTTLTVGFPDELPEQPERLPIAAFVHQEKYVDYDESMIDELYLEKESRPENKEFVKVNRKQTLAQVFTDCRYTKSANELFSEKFLELIKKQSFM